ncbi:MAG: hypothetical protein ACD_12C00343G0002 [uncultured bacterium]|nr:MAG: hypothetical protein ACD_12C00343G0002 [uncultured bacterium]
MSKENPSLWEYESINIGGYYFDGEDKMFEILAKEVSNTGNTLTVKVKIKLMNLNGRLIFAEDKVITVGKNINIFTNDFIFNNYVVSRID